MIVATAHRGTDYMWANAFVLAKPEMLRMTSKNKGRFSLRDG
jgi:hypothetical protein